MSVQSWPVLVFVLSIASRCLTVAGLICYECDDYGTFYSSPFLNALECLNTSNFGEVACPPGTRFCLSVYGSTHRSTGRTGEPGLEYSRGSQRGCFNADAIKTFPLDRYSFLATGGCGSGQKVFTASVPAWNENNSSTVVDRVTPQSYAFTGTYCLCQGDRCNNQMRNVETSSGVNLACSAITVLTTFLLQSMSYLSV